MMLIPLSFQDYATALQAGRMCIVESKESTLQPLPSPPKLNISGILSASWPVPFVFCDSNKCQYEGDDATHHCTFKILALSTFGSQVALQQMQRFKTYVERRHPQLTNRSLLPFDYDFIQVFDSNDDLDAYITSDVYGSFVGGKYFPKVAIGVVFGDGDGGNDKSYDYTIRVNSTNYNSQEQHVSGTLQCAYELDKTASMLAMLLKRALIFRIFVILCF